jgi:hypothetical protein
LAGSHDSLNLRQGNDGQLKKIHGSK